MVEIGHGSFCPGACVASAFSWGLRSLDRISHAANCDNLDFFTIGFEDLEPEIFICRDELLISWQVTVLINVIISTNLVHNKIWCQALGIKHTVWLGLQSTIVVIGQGLFSDLPRLVRTAVLVHTDTRYRNHFHLCVQTLTDLACIPT